MIHLSVCLAAAVLVAADSPAEARQGKAKALLTALTKEDFAGAGKDFDDTMKKALPEDKLRSTWNDLTGKVGAFRRVRSTRTETAGKYEVVIFTCEFARAALECRVAFDADTKVTGLFFRPARSTEFKTPPYANPDSYREVDVVVGKGSVWSLPGTLTLPKGEGPFPAVVLLHGSGPHDRDETLGPNKPFRDLAWGLASQGVAVLRYEKRTKEHPLKLSLLARSSLTVKEEVIDDALAAINLLRERKEIDPKRVYVVGHSLGAHVAPLVAESDPKLAGIVLMAGNSRPLEDLVLDQFRYLFTLEGKPSAEEEKQLAELKKQAARVKDPDLADSTPASDLPLGIPAPYWKALRKLDVTGVARKLDLPILVLHGERDYQVTTADMEGWKKALAGRPKAKVKSYPALNHLFMEGTGKPTPAEYDKAGHVARAVVDDVANWIKGK